MGCDIHAYIEYEEFIDKNGKPWISCFAEDIDFGRNYTLFALMAGVRYDPYRGEHKPLFQPKGIPKPLSLSVQYKYTLYVSDKGRDDGEFDCSLGHAEEWVRTSSSEWWDESHTRVTHPDWHSASWLSLSELMQVQEAYENIEMADSSWYQYHEAIPEGATATKTAKGLYVEVGERKPMGKYLPLEAIIAAMKVLDENQPGRSRLVFWFDN